MGLPGQVGAIPSATEADGCSSDGNNNANSEIRGE